jgi:enamine deaminase RidA (YjgF/YER057c/UK114 family)
MGGRVVAEIERFGVGKRLTDFIVHGDTIHFSGYVAEEAAGKSVTEQTRDILAQIDGSLAEAGSDKSKLIEATIWLADMATFGEMNAVWDAWVAPRRPPTRACVEARLASPQYAVEIRVLAAR